MFKLIVAGSRSFEDEERMLADLQRLLVNRMPDVEIVHGGCSRGAAALASRCALRLGLPVRVFAADWHKWGKAAGPIRNDEMARYGDALLCYWDGRSSGTKNMIRCARLRGLRVVVRRF